MVYTEHTVVKPEDRANAYVSVLFDELVLPTLVTRSNLDQFKGVAGDKVYIKVPGRLPARDYAFRNDRTNPVKFDVYAETRVENTVGDRVYSGVKIIDEQVDFDSVTPQFLVPIQARAVAEKINHNLSDYIEGSDFPVVIGGAEYGIRKAIIEARRVLGRLRVPGRKLMIVGSDFEAAMLGDKDLTLADNVGDQRASAALGEATLGSLLQFTYIVDQTIDPGTAYAFSDNAFTLFTGAPSAPASVPFKSTASYGGFSLRWLRDYDMDYLTDRSLVDTYLGFGRTLDTFQTWDKTPLADGTSEQGEVIDQTQHFARAIKLTLDGTSHGPAANSALSKDTGLVDGSIWQGEADPAE